MLYFKRPIRRLVDLTEGVPPFDTQNVAAIRTGITRPKCRLGKVKLEASDPKCTPVLRMVWALFQQSDGDTACPAPEPPQW